MRYFLEVASCVAHMLLRVSCAVSLFSFVSGSCVCSDYLVGMYFLVPGASLVVGHWFSILRFYAYRTSFLWSHRRVKFSYYIYKVNIYSRRRFVMFLPRRACFLYGLCVLLTGLIVGYPYDGFVP